MRIWEMENAMKLWSTLQFILMKYEIAFQLRESFFPFMSCHYKFFKHFVYFSRWNKISGWFMKILNMVLSIDFYLFTGGDIKKSSKSLLIPPIKSCVSNLKDVKLVCNTYILTYVNKLKNNPHYLFGNVSPAMDCKLSNRQLPFSLVSFAIALKGKLSFYVHWKSDDEMQDKRRDCVCKQFVQNSVVSTHGMSTGTCTTFPPIIFKDPWMCVHNFVYTKSE